MASIDIRGENAPTISEIHFADDKKVGGIYHAYFLDEDSGDVRINDGIDVLVVSSKQHALDLIKALEKAIELEWFKE